MLMSLLSGGKYQSADKTGGFGDDKQQSAILSLIAALNPTPAMSELAKDPKWLKELIADPKRANAVLGDMRIGGSGGSMYGSNGPGNQQYGMNTPTPDQGGIPLGSLINVLYQLSGSGNQQQPSQPSLPAALTSAKSAQPPSAPVTNTFTTPALTASQQGVTNVTPPTAPVASPVIPPNAPPSPVIQPPNIAQNTMGTTVPVNNPLAVSALIAANGSPLQASALPSAGNRVDAGTAPNPALNMSHLVPSLSNYSGPGSNGLLNAAIAMRQANLNAAPATTPFSTTMPSGVPIQGPNGPVWNAKGGMTTAPSVGPNVVPTASGGFTTNPAGAGTFQTGAGAGGTGAGLGGMGGAGLSQGISGIISGIGQMVTPGVPNAAALRPGPLPNLPQFVTPTMSATGSVPGSLPSLGAFSYIP